MTAEAFEEHREKLEQARIEGLEAVTILPKLGIPAGVYRSYVWDAQWLPGTITWDELRRAFQTSLGPLPVSLSYFPHQGVAQRRQEARQLAEAGLPFAQQFAAAMDAIDFGGKSPIAMLAYLLRDIHNAAAEDVGYFLGTIANLLQNQLVLRSGIALYRFTELEVYYWQRAHPDMYVHKGAEQRRMGQWYFNEADCLDLTFGSEEQNYYGGILLRGVQRLAVATDAEKYVRGPRTVLRELIASLGGVFNSTSGGLHLEDAPAGLFTPQQPWQVRRYGLRAHPEDENVDFLHRPYRFLVDADYLRGLRDKADVVRQLALPREEAKAILGYYPAV